MQPVRGQQCPRKSNRLWFLKELDLLPQRHYERQGRGDSLFLGEVTCARGEGHLHTGARRHKGPHLPFHLLTSLY